MVVRSPEVVPIASGATLVSTPATTVLSEITGMLLRNQKPLAGSIAYAYMAGETTLIGSSTVDKNGMWTIDTLPTSGLYDVRFGGLDTSPTDWLYDIQAYVPEELDETPPDGTALGGAIELEN